MRRTIATALGLGLATATLLACKGSAPTSGSAGAPSRASTASASAASPRAPASAPALVARDAGATGDAGSGSLHAAMDAGVACALLTGPVAMPFKRNGAISLSGDGIDAVFNDGGKPYVVHVSRTAKPKDDQGGADVDVPPCAVTATQFYCPDESGAVHRLARGGGPDAVVAHALDGTRIAAATLAGEHSVIAYLGSKMTGSGPLTTANVVVDDGAPIRIDDTGATAVTLAERGDGVLAVMVDARAALTVVHARALSWGAGALEKGEDTPAFVGNVRKGTPPQPVLAMGPGGSAFALVVLPDDTTQYGMVAVRVDDPPKIDEPATWSTYPSARGRLAIDAARGATSALVGRVRATGDGNTSPVKLELGRLDPARGDFVSLGFDQTDGDARDVALVEDASGDVWLLVTDRTGSFVERRRCAAPSP